MSFHLEGPWLTTTGKRRGKFKFRDADQARQARELDESWKAMQKKWGIESQEKKRNTALTAGVWQPQPVAHRCSDQPRIASLPFTGGPCVKPDQKVYTGSAIKGIGTMHKSNAVPIFSDEEAQDIAKMRR